MLSNKEIAAIRQEYLLKVFDETHLCEDGMDQFRQWFHEAMESEVIEPNAMTLATCGYNGRPSARIVLLKGIEDNGFVFYTNYDSTKGRQIEGNPYGALVFFWPELQRQVRIEGTLCKGSEDAADEYFYSRPFESQIGAHASKQSTTLASRKELEEEFERLKELFSKEPIIRPRHWGGYILKPESIEFWQGRQSRLHDRFLFTRNEKGWKFVRLAP